MGYFAIPPQPHVPSLGPKVPTHGSSNLRPCALGTESALPTGNTYFPDTYLTSFTEAM